jgi:hypothetical protein
MLDGAARFDPSGVLVAPSGRVHRGDRYTVESAVPAQAALARALTSAVPTTGSRDSQLPRGLDPALTKQPTGTFNTAVQELDALATQYRNTYQLDDKAPAGHTAQRLATFAKAQSGTAEQFVAAFAVQARALGYATRVVVGYDSAGCRDECTVRARDLTAWPEVRFDGIGWQRISVVPARSVDDPRPATPPTTATPLAQAGDAQANAPAGRPTNRRPLGESEGSRWWIVLVIAGALLLLAVGVLAIRSTRRSRRRHRRRHAAEPEARVAGAWLETLDLLGRRGLRPRRSMSASQISGLGAELLDPDAAARLRALAALTTRARFDAAPASEGDAARAWDDADEIAAALASTATRRARTIDRFDTRTVTSAR